MSKYPMSIADIEKMFNEQVVEPSKEHSQKFHAGIWTSAIEHRYLYIFFREVLDLIHQNQITQDIRLEDSK